ncbi:sarcosine oxidase subunit gamma [Balneatrix alpica]|uniref:sarcosine oxidase subunit gamma n=1 Tax=Balneatrix alpica TaxID=75684 RepID=UPI002739AF58|nr:sarcosine oxidase subunit gamma family protein [Balneatrix alpica]
MSKVAVFQQVAGASVRAESPLHHLNLEQMARQNGQGGVVLKEKKLLGHLVLRGSLANELFAKGVERVLGLALPATPLQYQRQGDVQVHWLAPDEWLIIVPGGREYELELALREAMGGHYSIVNVSGGQTVLELSGPDARKVLQKSTCYDVHPRNLPVGKTVTTTLAKTQMQLTRTAEDVYELVIRRSFADYAFLWLQDASAEYGLTIKA